MNAQLIYRTADPNAVRWFKDAMQRREEAAITLREFQVSVNMVFGSLSNRERQLRALLGLVVGVELAHNSELPPEGWKHDLSLSAFVPDPDSEVGRQWQREIDKLPAIEGDIDPGDIGMPGGVEFRSGEATGHIRPHIHLGVEGDILFVLWDVREVKEVVDAAIAEMGVSGWTEMKRSEWYARVEYFESLENDEHASD